MTSKIKKIKVKKLNNENFKSFGEVIEIRPIDSPNSNLNDMGNDKKRSSFISINDGFTERYHDLANIDVNDSGGRALFNLFRVTPLSHPLVIKKMERHPLASQAFFPLNNEPYLVVVAPAGNFQESFIQAFLASSQQGVNYSKGTWHHYCLALNNVSDFIVIDRGGRGENCDSINLKYTLQIELPQESLC